jgi:hypothetical protein
LAVVVLPPFARKVMAELEKEIHERGLDIPILKPAVMGCALMSL